MSRDSLSDDERGLKEGRDAERRLCTKLCWHEQRTACFGRGVLSLTQEAQVTREKAGSTTNHHRAGICEEISCVLSTADPFG